MKPLHVESHAELHLGAQTNLKPKVGDILQARIVKRFTSTEATLIIKNIPLRAEFSSGLPSGNSINLFVKQVDPNGSLVVGLLRSPDMKTIKSDETILFSLLEKLQLQDTAANRQILDIIIQYKLAATKRNIAWLSTALEKGFDIEFAAMLIKTGRFSEALLNSIQSSSTMAELYEKIIKRYYGKTNANTLKTENKSDDTIFTFVKKLNEGTIEEQLRFFFTKSGMGDVHSVLKSDIRTSLRKVLLQSAQSETDKELAEDYSKAITREAALNNGASNRYEFTIPIKWDDEWHDIQLMLIPDDKETNHYFLETNLQNIGPLWADIFQNKKSVHIDFAVTSLSVKNYLEDKIEQLDTRLKDIGYYLKDYSIEISVPDKYDFSSAPQGLDLWA